MNSAYQIDYINMYTDKICQKYKEYLGFQWISVLFQTVSQSCTVLYVLSRIFCPFVLSSMTYLLCYVCSNMNILYCLFFPVCSVFYVLFCMFYLACNVLVDLFSLPCFYIFFFSVCPIFLSWSLCPIILVLSFLFFMSYCTCSVLFVLLSMPCLLFNLFFSCSFQYLLSFKSCSVLCDDHTYIFE